MIMCGRVGGETNDSVCVCGGVRTRLTGADGRVRGEGRVEGKEGEGGKREGSGSGGGGG